MIETDTASSKKNRRRGRPSGAKNTQLKEAFLNAAIELFGSRGFEGVSLSQIANKVGADTGLTRYYFGSKTEVWEAAIMHLAEQFIRELDMDSIAKQSSKTEMLKSVIRSFVDASAKWPQMSRIIVFDGDNNDSRGDYISSRLVGPFYQLLSDLIEGAKSEGTIADVENRTIFFMITHGGSFPMALPVLTNKLPGGDIDSQEVAKRHAEALISLLFKDSSNKKKE